MLELQTNAVATVSSNFYDEFRWLNPKGDLYTLFLHTWTSLMRYWHPRVFGTNKDVMLIMLGDTEEAVQLVAFFRTWHLQAQLLGSRHLAGEK